MGRGTMADGADPSGAGGRQGVAQEATTLSTIAVQSGTTRIVIALLQVCERRGLVGGGSSEMLIWHIHFVRTILRSLMKRIAKLKQPFRSVPTYIIINTSVTLFDSHRFMDCRILETVGTCSSECLCLFSIC